MDFSNLELVLETSTDIKPIKKAKYSGDRYIIGCDPEDNDDELLSRGFNVFTVYDKLLQKVTIKSTTKKSFEEFSEGIIQKETLKSSFVISTKFIENGRPKSREYIRSQAH